MSYRDGHARIDSRLSASFDSHRPGLGLGQGLGLGLSGGQGLGLGLAPGTGLASGPGVRNNTREGMAELRRSQKAVPSTIDIRGYNPDVAMAVKVVGLHQHYLYHHPYHSYDHDLKSTSY